MPRYCGLLAIAEELALLVLPSLQFGELHSGIRTNMFGMFSRKEALNWKSLVLFTESAEIAPIDCCTHREVLQHVSQADILSQI